MKTIGIIGGMGPLATADLFKKIILNTKAEKDQDHLRILIDNNTNIADRTSAILYAAANPLPELVKSSLLLKAAGADFLIMPCNTAHYYYDEITANVDIPVLNMIKETSLYIKNNYENNTVGILATDGTINTGIYDKYFEQLNIKYVKPLKTQHKVMEFIYEVIKKGDYSKGTAALYKGIEELKEMGADVFVLACTELSAAKEIYDLQGNMIDPLEITAKAAIKFAGGIVNEV